MTSEEKTPQEIAVDIAEKELHELETICKYFSARQMTPHLLMKKHRDSIRKIINEKSANLLILKNHYTPPIIDRDLKDIYIEDMELKLKKLTTAYEEALKTIEVNLEISNKMESR